MTDRALSALSPLFENIYAEGGRPSIPPEYLLRALLLQVPYAIPSERRLCEHLEYHLLFRWFVGLDLNQGPSARGPGAEGPGGQPDRIPATASSSKPISPRPPVPPSGRWAWSFLKRERKKTKGRLTVALATGFPRLARDPAVSQRERKRILRLLPEDVTLLRGQEIVAQVRFRGGAMETCTCHSL
jgi:hypothetical protein